MFLLDDPLEQRMQLRYQETKNVVAIKLSATAALLPPTPPPHGAPWGDLGWRKQDVLICSVLSYFL